MMVIPEKCLHLRPGGGFLPAYGLQETSSRVNTHTVNPYKG